MATIYAFCNGCDMPDWHNGMAMCEDGHVLAEHVSSTHDFCRIDLGVDGAKRHEDGKEDWSGKRAKYAEHCPEGFTVEWVEQSQLRTHPGIQAAYAKNQDLGRAAARTMERDA